MTTKPSKKIQMEDWESEVIRIIAKLDNGSHSSNQLQGIDETLGRIISKTLSFQNQDLKKKIEEWISKSEQLHVYKNLQEFLKTL